MWGWPDNAGVAVYSGAEYLAMRVSLRVAHAGKVGRNDPAGALRLLRDAESLVQQMSGGDRQAWGRIVHDALLALDAVGRGC